MQQIYIDQVIGYDFWTGKGITSKWFCAEFDAALKTGEEIEVKINTPGGSVFEGIKIYNKIAENNDKVTTIIEGIAYSMGGVIAMAGKKRKAYKNTSIMIHNCSGGAYGNANDLRGALEMMEVLDKNLVTSIAQLTGLSENDVTAKWFDYRDHTLTAADALKEGLLTELIDINSEGVPDNLNAMSTSELFAFYNKQSDNKQDGFISAITKKITEALGNKNTPNAKVDSPPSAPPANNLIEDMKIKINNKMAAMVAILALSFGENETEKEVEITDAHFAKISDALEAALTAKATAENAIAEKDATITSQAAKITKLEGMSAPPQGETTVTTTTEGPKGEEKDEFKSETTLELEKLQASMKVGA